MAVREVSWEEVLEAGATIFGPTFPAAARTGGWHGELKAAFRRRALETHPDRAQHLGRSEAELAEEFRSVAAAYELLEATRGGAAPRRPRSERAARPSAGSPQGRAADGARRTEPRTDRAGDHWTAGRTRGRAGGPAEPRTDRRAAGATTSRTVRDEAADEPQRAEADAARRLWRAGLPQRRLRLAEFLYYSGRLSWADFVDAIAWQRRQRPEVGRIAVDFGFLERHQVLEILTRRRIEQALAVPFGEFAVRRGYLTAFQVLAILGQQLRLRRPLDQYFVERGLVSEPELDELRLRILRHNTRWAA